MATYADLLALGEDVRAEVLAGEVHVAPAPLPRHSRAQGALRRFIGGPYDDDDGFGGPGGWWILLEVDVELSAHDIVRPDLAGWRRQRLPSPWDTRPLKVAPDWICEVLSPSNAATDRVYKRNLYAKVGVPHFWMLDPTARTLETLRLQDGVWVDSGSYDDSAVVRVPPFEEVELAVARLFPPSQG
ncbi:MAG: Uma2 family endonuclease [Polyangiaceae bacterium]|nr:Uma2 family endonuclease [Myxococcales bacterium]MCB9586812.1 Uma2 family endonuclease [Polyangiaceae bacterium]MCB9606319.1 Uma2 family endonuclease [Polyangiaceae bacterium]